MIVGFATITIMYPAPKLSGQLYMKDLFVSSHVRGEGIGFKLMKHITQIALDFDCNRFDWTAESTNPAAGQFYRSIGASLIKEKEYYRLEGDALSQFVNQMSSDRRSTSE